MNEGSVHITDSEHAKEVRSRGGKDEGPMSRIIITMGQMIDEQNVRVLTDMGGLDVVWEAIDVNPWWGEAVVQSSRIQAERRKKYSGSDLRADDPFTNFILVASTMNVSVREVFKFYLAQKLARIMVSDKDYDDESYQDTLHDLANYSHLAAGWEKRAEQQAGDGA